MLYKNVASQKIAVFAYTASTGAAKTGDAAQITAYISKDFAAGAATNDTNPTEMDATNMPGWYVFDLTQAETNAEVIVLAPKSSTSGVVLDQVQVFTQDAAISSRASQTSVDDVPTVVEFEARTLVAADYVVVSDLPSVPTASDNATAAAAAVWNENMADHLGPTTTGGRLNLAAQAGPVGDMIEAVGYNRFKTTAFENMPAAVGLATANLDAQLAGLPTAADVQAAATAALEAYDPPTMAELTSAVAPLALEATVGALPTAAENADAVLDELLSGHTIPGSAGAGIAAAGTADDPWITVLPGSYNSGTAGAIIGALAAIDTTAVTITPANNAGHLTITAARTFEATISGLTIPANWVTALWTLKTDDSRPDVAALVQLRETNPAALSDGLQRLNGAALPSGVTAAAGSLTVNQAGGSVVVWLSDEVTARLGKATGIGWDVKFIDAAGDSDGADGTADVALTETKATA